MQNSLKFFPLETRQWARFTNSLRQRKPSFGIKIVLSGFTKDAQWSISAEKACTQLFCAWPYWICICGSFPFRCKMYGRRVFKWITQRDLLTSALLKLLIFAPLFNAPKKHVLNYLALEMDAICCWRSHTENREHMVEGRFFHMY